MLLHFVSVDIMTIFLFLYVKILNTSLILEHMVGVTAM